jgi:hypothetical protein
VAVYVPSTINVTESIDNQAWIDKTLAFLSVKFGGATSSPCLGAWVSTSGELVKESVNLCFAFCDQASLESHIDALYEYCLGMKLELAQEAIALEVNGQLYLV